MTDPNEIQSVIENEKFLAFFDFCYTGGGAESMIDGLCKVACASDDSPIKYISITLIFDTPSDAKTELAKKLSQRLTKSAFVNSFPEMKALVNVPCTVLPQPEHYLHQTDIVFNRGCDVPAKDAVNSVAYILRRNIGLDTETPQWWEDEEAPKRSENEVKNISARIKSFLGLD